MASEETLLAVWPLSFPTLSLRNGKNLGPVATTAAAIPVDAPMKRVLTQSCPRQVQDMPSALRRIARTCASGLGKSVLFALFLREGLTVNMFN